MSKPMGYSEEDGAVVLRMTRDDYDLLLLALGWATAHKDALYPIKTMKALFNRLTAGSPTSAPYEVTDVETPRI